MKGGDSRGDHGLGRLVEVRFKELHPPISPLTSSRLMGVPTSEVGYTSAMPRRKGHEVHKDMWGHWGGGLLLYCPRITVFPIC